MAYSKKISIFVEALVSGAKRKLREITRSVQDMGSKSRGAAQEVDRSFTLTAKSADFLKGAIKGMAVAAAGYFAMMATRGIAEMSRLAAKNLDLQASFETLAARHKLASDELIDAVSAAAKGTVDKFSLMLEMNKALRLGVATTTDEFVALMKIATVRAKEFGLTTKEAWGYLVTAIGRASPMIADNIGILLDANATYEEYGRQIGKSAQELTKLEQKEAIRQRILREGIPDMETWNQMGVTAASIFEQYDSVMAELRQELGELFLPVIVELTGRMRDLAKATTLALEAAEEPVARRRKVIEDLIIQTRSVAAAEREYAENLRIGSQGFITQEHAAKLAKEAIADYLQYAGKIGAAALEARSAQQQQAASARDLTDYYEALRTKVQGTTRAWADYYDAVARENASFGRRMADLQFRQTQAAENAAFRRGEILQRAEEGRQDAVRDFQHNLRRETERHHLDLQRMTQDHLDRMADLEYAHEKERSDLMRRAPWWIRNALKKEFAERERIAKTGDRKALTAFDKALLERIRAIDPAYAKELDLLLEKHEHEAEIEEREASKSRTRRQEDWNIQRRELDYQMQSRLRDIERDLQNQLNAWRFADQQRRENERRAMENLRGDHSRALSDLHSDLERRLAEINQVWERWGREHGESYSRELRRNIDIPSITPTPGGDEWTPAGGPPWAEWQRGAWNIPRTQLGVVHRGEMIVPAGPAEALREGGGISIVIENITLGGGGSLMDARLFGDELGEYLGRRIQQQGRG